MIYRTVLFFFLFFLGNFSYADTPAPAGCATWTPCSSNSNEDLETCIRQCGEGSVWFLSPQSYCCNRTQQYCKSFTSCDGKDLNTCNTNKCVAGKGMRYQNGDVGCCNSWASSACVTSCNNTSLVKSKSWFTISGRVIQCVKETLNLVFFSPNCHSAANLLPALQKNLKSIVYIMVILYVILFGMKLVVSPQQFNKREFFTFVLQISFVFYFSVGITHASCHNNGQAYRFHGNLNAGRVL